MQAKRNYRPNQQQNSNRKRLFTRDPFPTLMITTMEQWWVKTWQSTVRYHIRLTISATHCRKATKCWHSRRRIEENLKTARAKFTSTIWPKSLSIRAARKTTDRIQMIVASAALSTIDCHLVSLASRPSEPRLRSTIIGTSWVTVALWHLRVR